MPSGWKKGKHVCICFNLSPFQEFTNFAQANKPRLNLWILDSFILIKNNSLQFKCNFTLWCDFILTHDCILRSTIESLFLNLYYMRGGPTDFVVRP